MALFFFFYWCINISYDNWPHTYRPAFIDSLFLWRLENSWSLFFSQRTSFLLITLAIRWKLLTLDLPGGRIYTSTLLLYCLPMFKSRLLLSAILAGMTFALHTFPMTTVYFWMCWSSESWNIIAKAYFYGSSDFSPCPSSDINHERSSKFHSERLNFWLRRWWTSILSPSLQICGHWESSHTCCKSH